MSAAGRVTLAAILCLAGGCRPNPRNEIAAIADATMAEVARTASQPDRLCVERVIAPWQPPAAEHRTDPPAPPGFADLYEAGTFRGGGGVAGAAVGGVAIRGGAGCADLRGPLVRGDRAMLEVHLGSVGLNTWLRRTQADWRVVMTTTSAYPG